MVSMNWPLVKAMRCWIVLTRKKKGEINSHLLDYWRSDVFYQSKVFKIPIKSSHNGTSITKQHKKVSLNSLLSDTFLQLRIYYYQNI